MQSYIEHKEIKSWEYKRPGTTISQVLDLKMDVISHKFNKNL